MSETLQVLYDQNLVGHIFRGNKIINFRYDTSWITKNNSFPISYSLPFNESNYTDQANNYFSNLLPEGTIRSTVAYRHGVSAEDDFALLEVIGAECAGALQIVPDQELKKVEAYDYQNITESDLKSLRKNLDSPSSELDKLLKFSLAGAQEKCSIYYKDEQFSIPLNRAPSNHIVKFQPIDDRVYRVPENEVISTLYLKELGLNVAECKLLKIDGTTMSLHKRYDRIEKGDKLIRLHQEDVCQCLSIPPTLKYQSDSGIDLTTIAKLVRDHCSIPAKGIERLIDWVLGVVLIRNGDAHAKNFSFLYKGGQVEVTPLYDMVCTDLYKGKVDTTLALNIGDVSKPDSVTRKNLTQFAEQIDVKPRIIFKRLDNYLSKVDEAINKVSLETEKQGISTNHLKPLIKIFKKAAKNIGPMPNGDLE